MGLQRRLLHMPIIHIDTNLINARQRIDAVNHSSGGIMGMHCVSVLHGQAKTERTIAVTDWTSAQIPTPADWQAFERLCHRLWIRLWKDRYAQLNGRAGQAQQGVDIFGQIDGSPLWGGVQCKGRDGRFGIPVTERELRTAVEAAVAFEPKLH